MKPPWNAELQSERGASVHPNHERARLGFRIQSFLDVPYIAVSAFPSYLGWNAEIDVGVRATVFRKSLRRIESLMIAGSLFDPVWI